MPSYRLLHLDPFNGHIDRVETFHASDDVEAICRVQNRKRDHPAELWSPSGKVSRFEGSPDMANSPGSVMTRSNVGDPETMMSDDG